MDSLLLIENGKLLFYESVSTVVKFSDTVSPNFKTS